MTPFEVLCRRQCRSPLFWDDTDERQMTGHKMIQEINDKVYLIQHWMKAVQDHQTSYTNKQI